MKKLQILIVCMLPFLHTFAQNSRTGVAKESNGTLPDIYKAIVNTQERMTLFTQNMDSHAQEHDVNTIILDIEKYIDSLPKNKTRSDMLVVKYFAPLRLFFLTTTNKTTVATSFLYDDVPYHFCRYNDSALALQLAAIKNGNLYNLAKTTEQKIARMAMQQCLLPALKSVDEFKDSELKYVALSIYYGCTDNRDGAEAPAVTPWCMTLLARMADIQQYNTGMITAKGLLAVSEVFISDSTGMHELRRAQVRID